MGLRHAGLDRIERVDEGLRIGATTTLTRLQAESGIKMLEDAARNTASPTIRNMATVGGNLFTPPPGGDIAVGLLALDVTVTLASIRGERTLPLADFYTGFLTNQLEADELLVALDVPAQTPADSAVFIKFGRKQANTPSVVTVAVHLSWSDDRITAARIALGAAGPHPIRARQAEQLVVGTALAPAIVTAAAVAAAEESEPFTDAIATDWYRRRMIGLHVARALEALAPGAKSEDH
jgi:CO/xanthine dehydrogenase FAD-binding subunit